MEWVALRLELCTLLWLAEHAYRHVHMKQGQTGWFPLPKSQQEGEAGGGGAAEEVDLTQPGEGSHEDAVDLTVAQALPPPALHPQERKLLTDQLRKLLGRLQGPPVTDEHLRVLVDEYLRFMELKRAAPPQTLSPSAAVDDAWHCHMICTHAYAAFCERHFGAFVHHDPTRNPMGGRYEACLEAYRVQYDVTPPPSYWPEVPEAEEGATTVAAAAAAAAGTRAKKKARAATGRSGDGSAGGSDAEGMRKPRTLTAAVAASAAAAATTHSGRRRARCHHCGGSRSSHSGSEGSDTFDDWSGDEAGSDSGSDSGSDGSLMLNMDPWRPDPALVTQADVDGDFGRRMKALGGRPAGMLGREMPSGKYVYTLDYLEQHWERLVTQLGEYSFPTRALTNRLGKRRGRNYYALADMRSPLMVGVSAMGADRFQYVGERKGSVDNARTALKIGRNAVFEPRNQGRERRRNTAADALH
ncbi:hypothetical protein JKP88DRAFT_301379 [Tribonema minus]|uniref:Uncharacterized protein n=1 Tax=Tribonema minus TaxID=303371 RepID=A0A835Z9A5_9STRA|nr:hypothetical protein JKP88DRAFT_301379 [Tribonema minus]